MAKKKKPVLISNKYTDVQVDYLGELREAGESWPEIAKKFNKKFKCKNKRSPETLRIAYINNKGYTKSDKKVEITPMNCKIKRGNPNIQDTSSILVISDQHMPYEHPDMFAFLEAVKKKYKPTLVVNIGDECFPRDAEVLTKEGWVDFESLDPETEVMQYTPHGDLELVRPLRKVSKKYTGEMVERKKGNYYSKTTTNHDIVLSNNKGKLIKQPAFLQENLHYSIPRSGIAGGVGIPLSDNDIRLAVAVSADFSLRECGDIYGCFKKDRKRERVVSLLEESGLQYSANEDSRGYLSVVINHRHNKDFFSKEFNHSWLTEMSQHQKRVLLDELVHWDGHEDPHRNRQIYCSSLKSNIEFVQTLSHLCGLEASVRTVTSEFGISYQTSILRGKTRTMYKSDPVITKVVDLPVFCVTVPSGMILVRQEGKITVSGNCDKHAMSFHDSDSDLPSAGHELQLAIERVKRLEKMFPEMTLVDSNHGSMALRKFKHHGIPMKYLASQHDIYGVSEKWQWVNDLSVTLPNGQACYFCHGMVKNGIKLAAQRGTSVVQGHYHTDFKIEYIGNPNNLLFSLQVGCLIDRHSLAFAYDKLNLNRPIIGTGLIVDSKPILVPMALDRSGRWTRSL